MDVGKIFHRRMISGSIIYGFQMHEAALCQDDTMTDVGCNYFPKEEMWTSSDVVGRHRFDFSVPAAISERQQNRKSTGKLRSRIRRMPVHHLLWIGNKTPQLHIPPSVRDGDKISKCGQSNSLMSKLFLSDHRNDYVKKRSQFSETFSTREQVVEEPWLLQSSVVSLLAADFDNLREVDNERDSREYFESDLGNSNFLNASKFNEGFSSDPGCDVIEMKDACVQFDPSLTNYPVEEPWLVDSSISTDLSDVKIAADRFSNEPIEDQATQSAHHDQDMPSENLLHEEESNVMTEEDSVSTVILINSSLCTVQRIAVLENDKLVELLLEPVKNNVQCDSVYLGVVSKLVPHMGGAFVNIGSPRPSFMDIKCYREPFILPPFHDYVKEREACDTPYHENPGEQLDFPENGSLFEKAEELDDVDDGQSEDEFIDDEFGSHENGFHFDVSEINKGNVNGSVSGHEREDDGERYAEQLNGDLEQFQPENMNYDGADIKGTEESKWAHVQKGSKIIVQVIKEGLGTKGPTLTAYPKLRSRFWVLSTRSKTIGISKKISCVERTRLRVIAKTLQPPGFGLTVRTVASGHSLEELQKDLEGLLSTWKSIVEHAKSAALAADEGVDAAVPVMLHRAMGQTLSVVQDYFNEKVRSMVVDSPRTYHEVSNYLQEIAPDLCERVELYSKRTPLFDEYNIEGEINNILSKRVPLDNGGYLVIEQTEALVSIDVNGGHWMLGQGTSQEKAVLEVNLAAARQIARELRLRDIGGIIVVDFIDMLDDSNKRLVYEEVKRAVNRDRSTVKVSELSRHGLMEITRKRVRPSVTFMISEPCPCCHATGRVEALETSFSKIEHEICRLLSMMDQKADPGNPKSWPRFILRVDRHMCNYLTSGKRTRLATLSSSLKVWILLKVARGLTRGTFELKTLTDENMHRDQRQAAIPVFRPKEVVTYAPSRKVMLFPIKKWKTGGK